MKEYCSEDGGYNGPSAQILQSKRSGHVKSSNPHRKQRNKQNFPSNTIQNKLETYNGKYYLLICVITIVFGFPTGKVKAGEPWVRQHFQWWDQFVTPVEVRRVVVSVQAL